MSQQTMPIASSLLSGPGSAAAFAAPVLAASNGLLGRATTSPLSPQRCAGSPSLSADDDIDRPQPRLPAAASSLPCRHSRSSSRDGRPPSRRKPVHSGAKKNAAPKKKTPDELGRERSLQTAMGRGASPPPQPRQLDAFIAAPGPQRRSRLGIRGNLKRNTRRRYSPFPRRCLRPLTFCTRPRFLTTVLLVVAWLRSTGVFKFRSSRAGEGVVEEHQVVVEVVQPAQTRGSQEERILKEFLETLVMPTLSEPRISPDMMKAPDIVEGVDWAAALEALAPPSEPPQPQPTPEGAASITRSLSAASGSSYPPGGPRGYCWRRRAADGSQAPDQEQPAQGEYADEAAKVKLLPSSEFDKYFD
ncbi:uncharacterized protein B0T15DRAFT_493295 [Chaetomium strumarium]|uniref:Uncharacterized protein n=1 Tax=Chaetomium strumarium TaxID=1170767 RepID=A0AAJ0GS48_9PEZI|nr:hypothetical protein B0T15DRAFT_493295 [Chaetomium strumarium]